MAELKKCPYCAEEISLEAIKCKHCGEFLNKESINTSDKNYSNKTNHPLPAFLSLALPGLGQFFFGSVTDGIIWCLATILGYLFLIIPGIIIHIKCVQNAYNGSKKINFEEHLLKSYQQLKNVNITIYILLLVLVIVSIYFSDNKVENKIQNFDEKRMNYCNEMDAKGYKVAASQFHEVLNDHEKKEFILALGKIDSNFAMQAKAQGLKWTDDDAYKVMSSLCGKTLSQIKHVAGMH